MIGGKGYFRLGGQGGSLWSVTETENGITTNTSLPTEEKNASKQRKTLAQVPPEQEWGGWESGNKTTEEGRSQII